MGVQTPESMALIGQPIEMLDQWSQSAIIGGWGRETSPQGSCLTGQPIKNYSPALHVLGRGRRKVPPCLSLISEPPDNILILLIALCQTFNRNFPYIRTWLTLEYEIEFCFFSNPSVKNSAQSHDRPFHPVIKHS